MPAAKITTTDKAQAAPYEAANWNAQDANGHRDALNDHAQRLDVLYALLNVAPLPPASYSDTLSAGQLQVAGIVGVFASTQTLAVNLLPSASGGTLTLQLLDSSDGNSASSFDFQRDYAGTYYQFEKKDGTKYQGLWPAVDTTLTV